MSCDADRASVAATRPASAEASPSRAWTRRRFLVLLGSSTLYLTLPSLATAENRSSVMRIAVSAETIAGANLNDARAAYRVWGSQITRSLGVEHSIMVGEIFVPSARLIEMIREGSVDGFVITGPEYFKVVDLIDPTWLMMEDACADGVEYVLLARRDSAKSLEELRGGELAVHQHRDTTMMNAWLNVLLNSRELPPPERFFESLSLRSQINQVVLPLFFRRFRAAALARRAFDMAVEMNPQLGRELVVLATSPRLMPVVFCFRRGSNPEAQREFRNVLLRLTSVPAGQQILELYQVHGYSERPGSSMKTTVEMLREYERLQVRLKGRRP